MSYVFSTNESYSFKRHIQKRWTERINKIWCSSIKKKYYKYKKYYTNLDAQASTLTYDITESGETSNEKNLYNIPNPEEYKQWQKLELIDQALEDVYWYDASVFKLYYYEGNTLTGLAKKTGISRNSLFTTIDKVREQLKELLDNEI